MSETASITTRIRVGTRASRLARLQVKLVRSALVAARPELDLAGAIEEVLIRTSGDAVQHRALSEIGGKGLFAKEIDEALLEGRIDIAVHSMKDLETWLPDGTAIACVIGRDDPRDAMVLSETHKGVVDPARPLNALPEGAVVGTASLRRKAQLLHHRSDLEVVLFRGNVQTRLRKLAEGQADAAILAFVGLERLGIATVAAAALAPEVMLPAVGQGVVGVTCRADDEARLGLLAAINDEGAMTCVTAERTMLEILDGSCHTPIGGFAEFTAGRLRLRGLVARPDGSEVHRADRSGDASDPQALGRAVGEELRQAAGSGFFDGGVIACACS